MLATKELSGYSVSSVSRMLATKELSGYSVGSSVGSSVGRQPQWSESNVSYKGTQWLLSR